MFEELTRFIPQMQNETYGEWIIDKKNDDSPEHPIQWSFVGYSKSIHDLINAIVDFVDNHREMELTHYGHILEEAGIQWDMKSMRNAKKAFHAAAGEGFYSVIFSCV